MNGGCPTQSQGSRTTTAAPAVAVRPITREFMADSTSARFRFVPFGGIQHGHVAILGFGIGVGVATELLTAQGILQQVGLG